jgi:hypothetical protein
MDGLVAVSYYLVDITVIQTTATRSTSKGQKTSVGRCAVGDDDRNNGFIEKGYKRTSAQAHKHDLPYAGMAGRAFSLARLEEFLIQRKENIILWIID